MKPVPASFVVSETAHTSRIHDIRQRADSDQALARGQAGNGNQAQ